MVIIVIEMIVATKLGNIIFNDNSVMHARLVKPLNPIVTQPPMILAILITLGAVEARYREKFRWMPATE